MTKWSDPSSRLGLITRNGQAFIRSSDCPLRVRQPLTLAGGCYPWILPLGSRRYQWVSELGVEHPARTREAGLRLTLWAAERAADMAHVRSGRR